MEEDEGDPMGEEEAHSLRQKETFLLPQQDWAPQNEDTYHEEGENQEVPINGKAPISRGVAITYAKRF